MATEIGRLIATFEADISKFESGRKQVESGMQQTAKSVTQSQQQIARGELSMAQQLKASESLQRQRSAALVAQWKQQERAARNAADGVKPFRNVLQELSASVATLQGPLGPVSGRISALGTAMTSVTTATGGMLAAFGLTTAAAVGFGAAIFHLASNAATTADNIGDMAAKINFSVRTLSGLETAAHTAGSSLDGLVTALGIFDRNLESAAQGQERLSGLFKGLKIDVTDNEKAFRQVADVLFRLGGTSQQTALAMELFGRSGKDVLGIIKAADGNVEAFIKSMEELGIVIGEDAVKAADKFDRQITVVKAQIATVIRLLGEEFIPMVTEAASNLSTWLKNNQGEIRKTIVEIGNLTKTIVGLAQYIKAVSPIILIVETIHNIRKLFPGGPTISNAEQQRNVFTVDPNTGRRIYSGNAPFDVAGEFAIAGGAGQSSVGAGATRGAAAGSNALADQVRKLLGRGGGGGGGRGGGGRGYDPMADIKRMAELNTRSILENLKTEEDSIERSYDKRETLIASYQRAVTRLENIRHQTVLDGLKEEERLARESVSKIKDPKERSNKLAIELQEIEIKKFQEANRHREAQDRLEDKINRTVRERIALAETLVRLAERSRFASDVVLKELGGGSFQFSGEATRARRVADATRPRIATDLEESLRNQYQQHLDRMRSLAFELTSILDRAIFDGFEGGIKRGFQSLTLSVLDLVKNVFLKQLENAIAGALSGIGTGGGKGGFLSGLFKSLIGSIGFGGGGKSIGGLGSAFAGSFAYGGTIPTGQWGTVHENERVMATPYGAVVVPSNTTNNSGGNTVININIPESRAADSYKSPKSRRELATQIAATLQGHLR